jgi:hypothetical protein
VFATLEPTDTIVHSFTTVGEQVSTEHAIAYDGDQEYFYYIWRNTEDHITPSDGRTFENWQIGWKGSYKDVRKQYVEIVHDMILEGSGFYGKGDDLKPLPRDEVEATRAIDKIRDTSI